MKEGTAWTLPIGQAASALIRLDFVSAPSSPASGRRNAERLSRFEEALLFRNVICLDSASSLLLAVSGGPDSLAMMHLVARWAKRQPNPPVLHVATVDHGLRAEAAREAARVAEIAADLGLPHATLSWSGPKPSTRIQEKARAARYGLLADHARSIGATHVVTAHHADDQAETILLRLGRGSGLRGLAGMRRETALGPALRLIRPLLAWRKADLVVYCRDFGLGFVEDPSNRDPAFARARLRAETAALAELGLDTPALVRLGRRMARADAALEAATDHAESMRLTTSEGAIRLDLSGESLPSEILLRLVQRSIERVAIEDGLVRLERLESLVDRIEAARAEARIFRATLGGTRLTLCAQGTLTVTREGSRSHGRPQKNPSRLPLRPN